MLWIANAKSWARTIKRDVVALWLAARDRRVPWYAKAAAGAVAAYALSPIDLIPDFIPVLGYLDDLVIVPLGIVFAVRLIPSDLMAELRKQAAERETRPISRTGLAAADGASSEVAGEIAAFHHAVRRRAKHNEESSGFSRHEGGLNSSWATNGIQDPGTRARGRRFIWREIPIVNAAVYAVGHKHSTTNRYTPSRRRSE